MIFELINIEGHTPRVTFGVPSSFGKFVSQGYENTEEGYNSVRFSWSKHQHHQGDA